MSGEQERRALALLKTLSTQSAAEAHAALEQSNEDPAVCEEVRRMLDEAAFRRTGLVLGRYTVGEPLGRGGYGEVYRGQDTVLGRAVALKFLAPFGGMPAAGARRLLSEAQAASALNHPNIVTVFEVLDSESGPVMAMELVEGLSLRRELDQPVPPERARHYAVQLLEALAAAHAHRIVHRDLKPENAIVRPDGYLKVLDFGLARQLNLSGAVSRTGGMPAGTLRYMSPEQCRGQSATEASDLFSAGLILYELACGEHAFAAASHLETARMIMHDTPRPKGGGPLMTAAMRLLAKNPADRPSAKQALELLAASEPARGRWKMGMATAALAAVLAAAGAAWWMARAGRAPAPLTFRPLTSTSNGNYLTAGAVSPDGTRYALADAEDAIGLIELTLGGSPERVEVARLAGEQIDRLVWIGNSSEVLISSRERTADAVSGSLRVLDVKTRAMRKLPFQGRDALSSPDRTQIAYVTLDGRAIEIASLQQGRVERRVQVDDPTGIKGLLWSSTGARLHYWTVPEGRLPAFRWTKSVLQTVDVATGQLRGQHQLPPFFSATMLDHERLLAYTLSNGLVEMELDPADGHLRSEPRQVGSPGEVERSLSASRDGLVVVGIVRTKPGPPSVQVGEFDPTTKRLTNPQPLAASGIETFSHAWTPDNRAVIYESNSFGALDLYRHALGHKSPDRIVEMPGRQVMAHVSPDGNWIVFLSEGNPGWKLLRVPVKGGAIEEVPGGPVEEFNCEYRAVRCVVREYREGYAVFYEMDPVRGKGRELLRLKMDRPEFGDWVLSPDGRKISLVDASRFPAAIRVLDLDHPGQEQRVELEGPIPSGGLATWSADGQGWFLAQGPDRMMYFDQQGHGRFVHNVGYWLTPSWDGRKLAFIDRERQFDAYLAWR